MTSTKDLQALQASGQAWPIPLTREQKLEVAISALRAEPKKAYAALRAVEHANIVELRQRPVAGTPLEPIAEALGTGKNHGAVMDELDLTQHQLHEAFCECLLGNTVNGLEAAFRFRRAVADGGTVLEH